MLPASLSATSVQVLEACPMRWVAETFKRSPQPSSTHADLGSACHYGLEHFVKGNYHNEHKKHYDVLVNLYTEEYERLFDDRSRYDEGLVMLHNWWERTEWTDRIVLSTERKTSFPITVTWKGEKVTVPFNYIWDRCDLLEDRSAIEGKQIIEVIDYKTISRPIQPAELMNKIQARCYGLAAQIQYPETEKVWVTFDMLRFEPVGISFSREQNAATYRYLQRVLKRILAMDEADPSTVPEQLNAECNWCIRKTECKTLNSHTVVGGYLGIDPKEAAAQRYLLENKQKGTKAAIDELDKIILTYCETEDILEFATEELDIAVSARKTRALDSERAMKVVGPELIAEYGTLGVTAVDKLLKDPRLTPSQKVELTGLIRSKYGEPFVKITPKNRID